MQLSEALSEDEIERRCAFAREYGALLEGIPGVMNVAWCSTNRKLSILSLHRNTRITRGVEIMINTF
jgi:hypothetical protein